MKSFQELFANNLALKFVVVVILPTIGFCVAVYNLAQGEMSLASFGLLAVTYYLTEVGVTIGYHRLITHQSFQTYTWVKALILLFASMSMQGSAVAWASFHAKHHAFSDKEGDPHSPNLKGFIHAHVGWIFSNFIPKGREVINEFGDKFERDKMVMFFSRYYFVFVLIGVGLCYPIGFWIGIGGWNGVLWGGLVRLFLTSHATWSVNSLNHMVGSRTYETKDKSRNIWWMWLWTIGENWHNNHHHQPRSAFHGMKWYQLDISGLIIKLMMRMRLVWNVYGIDGKIIPFTRKHYNKAA